MKSRTGGMHNMGRPKGSKNKPKIDKVKPVEDSTLFHWNETIQKLNDMKEEGNWMQESNQEPETTPTEVQPKKGRKPATDKYNHCERCGTTVMCEPFRADLNILTGRADYHRQSPRYIKLCSKCSMELSNLVDKWFIDGGGLSKFDKE